MPEDLHSGLRQYELQSVQINRQVGLRSNRPVIDVLRQHLGNDAVKLHRRLRIQFRSREAGRVRIHYRSRESFCRERDYFPKLLVKNYSKRKNVGSSIRLLLANHFGRHVIQCSYELRTDSATRNCHFSGVEVFCYAEVQAFTWPEVVNMMFSG